MRESYIHSFAVCLMAFATASICLGTTKPDSTRVPRAIHYWGRIVNRYTGEPIEAVSLKLIPGPDACVWRTDSKGRFSFWTTTADRTPVIEIGHDGYEPVSLQVKNGRVDDIRLTPISGASINAIGISSSADRIMMMPASQAVAPAIATADSGRKASGKGDRWSPWYQLALGTAPNGYTVQRVEFWLSGDGTCGFSAECQEVMRNDQHVLWRYRLRGHSDPGAPLSTVSVAHIRVTYRLATGLNPGH